ncbi:leucine rich repeat domain-containing protein [Histoplasma capsulatum]|uniref:Leucine rich repeat domain-containing protein n=1 Tax=Ajellomyces capsulatus TaxID=5037 RepID=A0A8A1MH69_AJECA|nr:leucine rich repeat domain-containing protein [Histoplasma capsulatum]
MPWLKRGGGRNLKISAI